MAFCIDAGLSPSYSHQSVSVLDLPTVSRDLLNKVLTCEASNTDLSQPEHASLQLAVSLPPDRVEVTAGQESLQLGRSLELTCRVWGGRPAPHIQWRGDFLSQEELRYKVSGWRRFIGLFYTFTSFRLLSKLTPTFCCYNVNPVRQYNEADWCWVVYCLVSVRIFANHFTTP